MLRPFLVSIFIPLFLPALAIADTDDNTYELIAPVGTLSGAVTLESYVNGIFTTAIGLAGVLAVVMLVICGIKLMASGSAGGKSEAKECIWNAIFGVLLAIGSWLLLNTINPLLLRNDAELAVSAAPMPGGTAGPGRASDYMPREPGWYFRYSEGAGTKNSPRFDTPEVCKQLQKDKEASGATIDNPCFEVAKSTSPTPSPTTPPASGPQPTPPASGSSDEKASRMAICGNDSCVGRSDTNVFINRAPCGYCGQTSCTDAKGLPGDTISMIKSLPGAFGESVTITGGTECTHKSHGVNKPIFDIRTTSKNVAFIKSNGTGPNASFGGFSKWLYGGYWFTYEVGGTATHWHICKDGFSTSPACKKT